MINQYIQQGSKYRSFSISDSTADTGFRLGGTAPVNIKPKSINSYTKYLMTMPLDMDYELSIFHSFNFDNDGESNPFDMSLTFFDETNNLVQFVIHPSASRGESSTLDSEMSAHQIYLSSEVLNDTETEDEPCYPFHKVGGIPYFSHLFDSGADKKSMELISDGYFHLLQLAFPVGPNDGETITGDWPFGEAVFHVFAKQKENSLEFIYIWA